VRRHSLGYPFAIPGAFPLLGVLLDQNPVSALTAGKLAMGVEKNPAMTIRVSESGIEVGGLLPLPLAMGPATATAIAAISTFIGALMTALANPANLLPNAVAADPALVTALTAFVAAMATAGPAIPATITKGQ